MKDSDGNSSKVLFSLKPSPPVKEVKSLETYAFEIGYDITENTMMVIAKPCMTSENKAVVYADGSSFEIFPDYYNANRSVYLIDLRKTIPDSVTVCGSSVSPKINISVPSGTEYKYYGEMMDVQFPINAIYDTLYLTTDYAIDQLGHEVFTIGSRTIPLHKSLDVSLKPAKHDLYQPGVAVYRISGKSYSYVGGQWVNGRVNFTTRDFGDFTILKDSIAPKITPQIVNNHAARFKIKDELSGISKFEATIDGQWLLMNYDSKSNTIWSKSLNPNIPLKGNFELVVTDNAGNKSRYLRKIL